MIESVPSMRLFELMISFRFCRLHKPRSKAQKGSSVRNNVENHHSDFAGLQVMVIGLPDIISCCIYIVEVSRRKRCSKTKKRANPCAYSGCSWLPVDMVAPLRWPGPP